MRKKIGYILLMFCLLFSLTACGKETEKPDTDPEVGNKQEAGNQQEETKRPSAGKDGAVVIKTAEDLVAFANRVNEGEKELNAVLDADIDMSSVCGPSVGNWTPIRGLAGEFDGNGHIISGLYAVDTKYCAPFMELRGTVKNLTIKDVVMESAERSAAGLVSDLYGTIENCTVSGSVKGYEYAGGFATVTYTDSVINGCVNEATVEGGYFSSSKYNFKGNAAGIAACAREGGQFIGCINRGTIIGNGLGAGGIIGGCSYGFILAEDCVNEGAIEGPDSTSDGNSYVGGIAGYGGENTVINRCVNKGTVTSGGIAAGIIGNTELVVINCANRGEVIAIGEGQAYGITCEAVAGMVNCYTVGNITCERWACALGYSARSMDANLYNYGTITCTGADGVLTDGFPWSGGGATTGLLNTWSREDCITNEQDSWKVQRGNATALSAFTDGTILTALNELVDSYNNGGVEELNTFREAGEFTLESWTTGADGLPCFTWE